MVDGEFIMRDNKVLTMDEEAMLREADAVGEANLESGRTGEHSAVAAAAMSDQGSVRIMGSGDQEA